MSQNARKIYDRKIEESKGPAFDLIGTGISSNIGMGISGSQVDPKSLYKRANHSVGRANTIQKRGQKGSHSVRPFNRNQTTSKVDFNLSGVNIPVHQNEPNLNYNNNVKQVKPPLPGRRMKGPNKFKKEEFRTGGELMPRVRSIGPNNNDLAIGAHKPNLNPKAMKNQSSKSKILNN